MIRSKRRENRGSFIGPRDARIKAKARVTENKQESARNVTKLEETKGPRPYWGALILGKRSAGSGH